jgi:hypothetical protein
LAQIVEYSLALSASLLFSLFSFNVFLSFSSLANSSQIRSEFSNYVDGMYYAFYSGYWSHRAIYSGEILSCSNRSLTLSYSGFQLKERLPFDCSFKITSRQGENIIIYSEGYYLKAMTR